MMYMSSNCMKMIQPAIITELVRMFLHRAQEQNRERHEEPADDEQSTQEPFHDSVFRRMKYCVSSGMFAYQMSMYWLKPM